MLRLNYFASMLSRQWAISPQLKMSSSCLLFRVKPSGTGITRHLQNSSFVEQANGSVLVAREVSDAIKLGHPVVALESAIITHGMPYPHNLQTALQLESIIRQNGSLPATIGVIKGKIFVGLQQKQLQYLAQASQDEKVTLTKVSRNDLPLVCAMGLSGGTTVSGTSYLANLVGIRVFVTGGIGGVHRGAEVSMDISADLTELARTPITVISAGVKSILDIGKTLEVLETNGVCVAVYQGHQDKHTGQVEFPAFFTPKSGIFVNYNLHTPSSVAELIRQRDALLLRSGILLAVPNYIEEYKIYRHKVEQALIVAEQEMREKNIQGKQITPFLLARINELTEGESLRLNQKLIEQNVLVGAQVAREYSRLSNESSFACKERIKSIQSTTTQQSSENSILVVIGGSICDIVTKAHSKSIKLDGTTYSGSVQTYFGGVARNVADTIQRLGQQCLLITAVGDDQHGRLVREYNPNLIQSGFRILQDLPTSACCVTIDNNGECLLVVGDLRAHQRIDRAFVSQFEHQLNEAPIVVLDGNISHATMDYVLGLCQANRVPVWYEPTDFNLACKILDRNQITDAHLKAVKFVSPNFIELQQMYRYLSGDHKGDLLEVKELNSEKVVSRSVEYAQSLLHHLPSLYAVLATIGIHGIVYVSRTADLDSTLSLGPNSALFDVETKLNEPLHLHQQPVNNVVNVSGAGDCLVGGVVYCLLHGQTIRQSLHWGLKAAHLSASTAETVPVNLGNLLFEAKKILPNQKN